jgi:hypothetical protein
MNRPLSHTTMKFLSSSATISLSRGLLQAVNNTSGTRTTRLKERNQSEDLGVDGRIIWNESYRTRVTMWGGGCINVGG